MMLLVKALQYGALLGGFIFGHVAIRSSVTGVSIYDQFSAQGWTAALYLDPLAVQIQRPPPPPPMTIVITRVVNNEPTATPTPTFMAASADAKEDDTASGSYLPPPTPPKPLTRLEKLLDFCLPVLSYFLDGFLNRSGDLYAFLAAPTAMGVVCWLIHENRLARERLIAQGKLSVLTDRYVRENAARSDTLIGLDTKVGDLTSKIEALTQATSQNTSRSTVENASSEIEALNKKLTEQTEIAENADKRAKEVTQRGDADIASLRKEIRGHLKAIDDLEADLDKTRNSKKSSDDESRRLRDELTEAESSVDDLQSRLDKNESEMELLKQRSEDNEGELNAMLTQAEQKVRSLQHDVDELKLEKREDAESAELEIKSLKERLDKHDQDVSWQALQEHQRQTEVDELKKEIATLSREKESAKAQALKSAKALSSIQAAQLPPAITVSPPADPPSSSPATIDPSTAVAPTPAKTSTSSPPPSQKTDVASEKSSSPISGIDPAANDVPARRRVEEEEKVAVPAAKPDGTSARGEQVPAKKSEAPKHSQQGGRGSRQKTGLPAYLVGYKPLTPFEMASRDVDSDAARALRGELAAPSPVAAPSPPPTLSPAPATAAAPATPASTPKTDQKQHSSRAASKSKPALPAHLVGYKAPTPFELAQRDRDSDAARALRGESSGPSPVAAPAPVPAPAPAPAPAPVTTASRPTTEKKPQPSTGRSKAKPSLPAHLLGSQPLSPFEMAQRDLDGPAARALRGEPPSSSAVAGAPAPQTAPVEKAPASPTKATDTPKSDESARQQKSQRGGSKAKPSLPAHLMGQQASTPFEMAMRDLESHAARALRGESPTPLSSEAQQGKQTGGNQQAEKPEQQQHQEQQQPHPIPAPQPPPHQQQESSMQQPPPQHQPPASTQPRPSASSPSRPAHRGNRQSSFQQPRGGGNSQRGSQTQQSAGGEYDANESFRRFQERMKKENQGDQS